MDDNRNSAENSRRKAATTASINLSKRTSPNIKRVSSLLRRQQKKELTDEEQVFLDKNKELVTQFQKRKEKRAVQRIRQSEQEDSEKVLKEKCLELAQAIHDAEFLVVYTGAGISTSAKIPDYRGPNGIWTKLQKGEAIGNHDLTAAEPTLTHMALSKLYEKGIVRHVVSQNCDGLHLRSGLPKSAMSEVHGNMYVEVCKHCVPSREYVRSFDATEKTSTFQHTTGRRCYKCGEPLLDSIVHFGERGRFRWPLNWQGACVAANACDTILCLGSSLKVLKKYTWLWQTDRPARKRPQLYIVNLQWTPKDKDATLKINGKCDVVMKMVMQYLGLKIDQYRKDEDPIFDIATPLHIEELSTTSQPHLLPTPSAYSDMHIKKEEIKDEEDIKATELTLKTEVKEEIKLEDTGEGSFEGFSPLNADGDRSFSHALALNHTLSLLLSRQEIREQFYGTGLCIKSSNSIADDSDHDSYISDSYEVNTDPSFPSIVDEDLSCSSKSELDTDSTSNAKESDKENDPVQWNNSVGRDVILTKNIYFDINCELMDTSGSESVDFAGFDSSMVINSTQSNDDSIYNPDSESQDVRTLWDHNKKGSSNTHNKDVENIWFWGVENPLGFNDDSSSSSSKRVTRSSRRQKVAVKCHCQISNPDLCKVYLSKPPSDYVDDSIRKARDVFRKRKVMYYRRYESIFEVSLESITYSRQRRPRQKKQFVEQIEDEDYEEDDFQDVPKMDEDIKVEQEETKDLIAKDKKITPGWYGKGYRKIQKKKGKSQGYKFPQ